MTTDTQVPTRDPVRIDPSWTVREVVTRYPAAVAIFKAFKVEACCDAGRPLGEAAQRAGVSRDVLIEALELNLRGAS
jgi:iron-sulfur cluster repair protein YtfE (RIC family)